MDALKAPLNIYYWPSRSRFDYILNILVEVLIKKYIVLYIKPLRLHVYNGFEQDGYLILTEIKKIVLLNFFQI